MNRILRALVYVHGIPFMQLHFTDIVHLSGFKIMDLIIAAF